MFSFFSQSDQPCLMCAFWALGFMSLVALIVLRALIFLSVERCYSKFDCVALLLEDLFYEQLICLGFTPKQMQI